ncbi:hypothetical protein ZEAMMB73_Zm00001d025971 [Zea mays]|uniref:Uncharacterized protein n=1 Tax=Zea mays TaxID=4577 RepID=A0A1D6JBB5_MAIZE|nr:hypothetical protein ZEAMMB73_Zm00001d025971 [Zea mays]
MLRVMTDEFELDSIKKLSREYAEAKELALAGAYPLPLLDMCILLPLRKTPDTTPTPFLIQLLSVSPYHLDRGKPNCRS